MLWSGQFTASLLQYSPFFFYLVEHPKGRVLFDTGLHPDIRTNITGRLGPAAAAFPIQMFEDGDLVSQLAKLGLQPGDIHAVRVDEVGVAEPECARNAVHADHERLLAAVDRDR